MDGYEERRMTPKMPIFAIFPLLIAVSVDMFFLSHVERGLRGTLTRTLRGSARAMDSQLLYRLGHSRNANFT